MSLFYSKTMRYSKVLVLLICLFLFSTKLFAQSSSRLTSDGKDFFLGYMPSSFHCSYTLQYTSVWALISTQFDAKVTISYFDDAGNEVGGANYTLSKNSSSRIRLATGLMSLHNMDSEQAEYKACHITSTAPISVQYYSTGPSSGGLYLALPNRVLGKKYVIMTLPSNPGIGNGINKFSCPADSSSSEFMIIAPYNNTIVNIHNTGLTIGGHRGIAYGKNPVSGDTYFTQKLMRGQVYMVKATKDDPTNSQEGTYIESDKPIVVLAAEENATNGIPGQKNVVIADNRDLTIEEMMPVEYWDSKDYFSMSLLDSGPGKPGDSGRGEQYRIYSMNFDRVIVRRDQDSTLQFSVGRFNNFAKIDHITSGVNISTDQDALIGVEMFDYRQQDSSRPYPAPSQMNIVPASRWRKNFSWMVSDDEIIEVRDHFINIITEKDSMVKIWLRKDTNAPVPLTSLPVVGSLGKIPGRPDLLGRRIALTPGSYSLTGNTPCIVYNYAMEAMSIPGRVGTGTGSDYYFGYAAPAGQSFSYDGGSSPIISVVKDCANWEVVVKDTMALDDGIASIDLLHDPDGLIYSTPHVSRNVDFLSSGYQVVPGSTRESFTVAVLDPLEDAYAALHIINHAGIDTLIELSYKAPTISVTKGLKDTTIDQDSLAFPVTVVHDQICSYFTLRNTGAKGSKPFLITSVTPALLDHDIKIATVTPPIPTGGLTLNPGDTLRVDVCYTPSDTGTLHEEAVKITTDCFQALLRVTGSGSTPLIQASDWNFGEVLVGDTAYHTVRITNKGTAPLTLTKNYILHGSIDFSLDTSSVLPVTIKPGKFVDMLVRYHPTAVENDTATIIWASDIRDPFKGQLKDYSGVFGRGIEKGLQWDRLAEIDTLGINDTKTVAIHIGSSIQSIDSAILSGPNAAEYSVASIVDTTIYVTMHPNLDLHKSNPYEDRHASLSIYVNGGSIAKKIDYTMVVSPTYRVEQYKRLSQFIVQPNPSKNGAIIITLSGKSAQTGTLAIYNVLGVQMYVKQLSGISSQNVEISPGMLTQGSYYIRLEAGGKIETQKIIVE